MDCRSGECAAQRIGGVVQLRNQRGKSQSVRTVSLVLALAPDGHCSQPRPAHQTGAGGGGHGESAGAPPKAGVGGERTGTKQEDYLRRITLPTAAGEQLRSAE